MHGISFDIPSLHTGSGRAEQLSHLSGDLKGIGHVQHVGLFAGPAAVRVEVDCSAFVDEAPTHDVGFLAVTAGRQAFGVAG